MSQRDDHPAPGGPGLEPRWTSSAKSGVGTAFDGRSLVWFTISHGILNEVYYPRVDQANTRDFGLLVTDSGVPGATPFFSEEKRHAGSVVHLLAPGVPGYRLINTCNRGRYQIEKTIITDPERDAVVQRIRFRALVGNPSDYRVFALLAPHIGNQGRGNDAWCDDYKGVPMLFAQRKDVSLAVASSCGWRARSCGYAGVNDGWHQVQAHRRLVDLYTSARNGNVALTGELDLEAATRSAGEHTMAEFVLVLAFGTGPAEAAQGARMTLVSRFDAIADTYVREWQTFHDATLGPKPTNRALVPDEMRETSVQVMAPETTGMAHSEVRAPESGDAPDRTPIELPEHVVDLYHTSTAVLACHEDKRAIGAVIASLSVPWGQSKGDHEMGGYHLVWPRDLVESAGALLASGHHDLARRTLRYLVSTQEANGHWSQNMWLDGTPYWRGIQLDETAFPILFAAMLRRAGALEDTDPWPMIRKAAGFLVRRGPVTEQDRWEEDGGYSPFTLAVEIAALVVAAEYADQEGESGTAALLRDTADAWNESIERWTYVSGTEFARLAGVDGYYTRIAPPELVDGGAGSAVRGHVAIRNRLPGWDTAAYENLVSAGALALVRFGLRGANDRRIVNTVRVIDALLSRRTKTGPIWYRYNNDGYGEHEDGSPFDGVGIGRGWPLLAGERAHYELARGRPRVALHLLSTMRAQTSDGGMLPEQVWDTADLPERELYNGRPTGSAMPLVWAHAEYVKLVRSLRDGVVFDMPEAVYNRYVRQKVQARHAVWCPGNKIGVMRAGRVLRVQTAKPSLVHWSLDGWGTVYDSAARHAQLLGVWTADLDTSTAAPGAAADFTLYYPEQHCWEGRDYRVTVVA